MSAISIEKKICFIHIPRTGGGTIKNLLSNEIKDLQLFSPDKSSVDNIFTFNHKAYDFFKFSYVRNPYDWIVSLYSEITNNVNNFDYQETKNLSVIDFIGWLQDVGFNRKDFCNEPVYRCQSDYLIYQDRFIIDKIFRYEDLCDDVGSSNVYSLFSTIGINFPTHVPLKNKSDRTFIINDYFDAKCYYLINKIFKKDFDYFRYKTQTI